MRPIVLRPGLLRFIGGATGLVQGVSREATLASNALGGAIVGNAAFAAAGALASFAGFAASAAGSFVALEKQWAEVTTLMPQQSEKALKDMKGQVDRFARETGTTLADAYSGNLSGCVSGD